jgi:hypothetical protein
MATSEENFDWIIVAACHDIIHMHFLLNRRFLVILGPVTILLNSHNIRTLSVFTIVILQILPDSNPLVPTNCYKVNALLLNVFKRIKHTAEGSNFSIDFLTPFLNVGDI